MRTALVACALVPLALVAATAAAVEATDVVRRSFTLTGAGRAVEVDNVFGAVHVRAGAGDRVELVLTRRWQGDDAAALELARREVTLEVVERPGRLELVQDGPFRDRCDCDGDDARERRRRRQGPDYEVDWSWELVVPADVALEVGTVNGGDVVVEGVRGPVAAANVNGAVRLTGLGGRASASTVNGDLEAEFARPLVADAEFTTVNGDVELAFPAGFGAELAFSTMHGEVYTDFPVAAAAVPAPSERVGGRYRLGTESVVRLGGGGRRLSCSTINGDIVVRER
jgi:hypothetical protein